MVATQDLAGQNTERIDTSQGGCDKGIHKSLLLLLLLAIPSLDTKYLTTLGLRI